MLHHAPNCLPTVHPHRQALKQRPHRHTHPRLVSSPFSFHCAPNPLIHRAPTRAGLEAAPAQTRTHPRSVSSPFSSHCASNPLIHRAPTRADAEAAHPRSCTHCAPTPLTDRALTPAGAEAARSPPYSLRTHSLGLPCTYTCRC